MDANYSAHFVSKPCCSRAFTYFSMVGRGTYGNSAANCSCTIRFWGILRTFTFCLFLATVLRVRTRFLEVSDVTPSERVSDKGSLEGTKSYCSLEGPSETKCSSCSESKHATMDGIADGITRGATGTGCPGCQPWRWLTTNSVKTSRCRARTLLPCLTPLSLRVLRAVITYRQPRIPEQNQASAAGRGSQTLRSGPCIMAFILLSIKLVEAPSLCIPLGRFTALQPLSISEVASTAHLVTSIISRISPK